MTTRVGMIGLGNIGLPLAINLIRSGLEVVGYSRDNLDAFARAGGIAAASSMEVAAAAEVILHSLPSVEALEDVVHGPAGILKSLRRGAVVIELSTYPLEVKQQLAATLTSAGADLLDCEMSGTPAMVAARECVILMSGEQAVAQRLQPLLERAASRAAYLGPLGTSLRFKLINNLLGALHLAAAGEAVHLCALAGIDPAMAVDLLGRGASSSAMLKERGPRMAEHRYSESNGTLVSLSKYLDLGEELLREMDAASPIIDAALPFFRKALAQGRGDEDTSVIFEAMQPGRRSGR